MRRFRSVLFAGSTFSRSSLRRRRVLTAAVAACAALPLLTSCVTADGLHLVGTPNGTPSTPPPQETGYSNTLLAVGGASATDVWALGGSGLATRGGPILHPFALRWNGRAWTRYSWPGASNSYAVLDSIAVVSAKDLWAGQGSVPATQATVWHFDGSTWHPVQVSLAGYKLSLPRVAAESATSIWAFGGKVNASTGASTLLLEHYNGHSWTPLAPPINGFLEAMTVAGGSVYLAASDSLGVSHFVKWDGTSWSTLPTLGGAAGTTVHALSASSASDVWAVGEVRSSPGAAPGRAWHLVAGKWIESVPEPRLGITFTGVDARNPQQVWICGISLPHGAPSERLLVSRWTPSTGWSTRFEFPANFASLQSISVIAGHTFSVGGGIGSVAVQN